MTIELVTGHTGKNHITAATMAGFNSLWHMHGTVQLPQMGFNGNGAGDGTNESAMLTWPTITVKGTVATIPVGMWLINGRLITVSSVTTVELPAHSSGAEKRTDYIYLTYNVGNSGVESAGIAISQGTPNSLYETPQSMLWPTSGSAGGSRIACLSYEKGSTTPTVIMVGARHIPEDFVYRRVWNMWGGQVEFIQHGAVCTLSAIGVHKSNSGSWYAEKSAAGMIPKWACPMSGFSAPVQINNAGDTTGYLGVYSDGHIQLGNSGAASSTDACYGVLTWVVI